MFEFVIDTIDTLTRKITSFLQGVKVTLISDARDDSLNNYFFVLYQFMRIWNKIQEGLKFCIIPLLIELEIISAFF